MTGASWQILEGDCRTRLAELPAGSVHTCVTSPPYFGLRDYGHDGQIGLEATPDEFVAAMVAVFREVRRVLRDDGTLWLNLGDSYASAGQRGDTRSGFNERYFGKGVPGKQAETVKHLPPNVVPEGCKPKDLIGIPWMVAFALRADGWYLRSDIIWAKPNPMPESVTDRPTKAHEYLFLLSKQPRYYYDADAIREDFADERNGNPGAYHRTTQASKGANNDRADLGFLNNGAGWDRGAEIGGRNKRSVWTVATQPYSGAHFATFPPKLIEPCVLAGAPEHGVVLDPFNGAGTTGLVALRHSRSYIGIELNPEYAALARDRIRDDAPLLNTLAEAA